MTQKRAVVLIAALLFAACSGGEELQVKEKPPADTTPPTVSNLAVTPATAAKGTTVTVSFSVDEELKRLVVLIAGRSAECATTGSDSSCTYTMLGDESAGPQLVNVRAIDLAGNAGTAETSFTLDYGAPRITITAKPAPLSNVTNATVEFTADDAEATFRCSLDGAAAQDCTSPYTSPALTEGGHTFEVFAKDALANESSEKFAFSTDLTAPETALIQGVPALTRETTHEVLFRSNDFQARFECKLDAAQFQTCASPFALTGFAEGDHTFTVRALDEVGNADATPESFTFKADRTAPVTTLAPLADTGAKDQTITFTVSETSTTFCSLDGAPFEACTSPVALTALAEGDHSFDVRSTDAAGNAEAVPASLTFIVDTGAPSAAIYAGPNPFTSQTTATLQFSSNEPGSSFKCSLDGAQQAACTSPHSESNLPEGQHRFEVVATDKYGNVDPTPAAYNWVVDTTSPVATFATAVPALVLQPSLTVTFSADEAVTWECSFDGSPFAACQTPHTLTDLTDNVNNAQPPHTFTVRATDRAGNVGQDLTATFDVNLSYPTPGVVRLVGPDPSRQSNTTPTFAWFGSDCDSYDFTLSSDPTFNDPSKNVVSIIDTPDETFTPSAPLTAGLYYVKMRGKNLTGYGEYTTGDIVQIGGGATGAWTKITRIPTGSELRGAACRTADRCVFVGASGELFRTTDGGKTFLLAASGSTSTITSVAFLDDSVVLAVGNGGLILRSVNGGLSWARITRESTGATLPTNDLKGLAVSEGLAFAVGSSGTLLKSTDNGLSWTKVTQTATTSLINAIQIVSSSLIVAVDDFGKILKSTDGGATWVMKFDMPGSYGWSISFFDELNGFATADAGKVYVTTDGGETWVLPSPVNPHLTGHVQAIRAISADSAIFVQTVGSTSAFANVRKLSITGGVATWTEGTRADAGAVRGFTLYGLAMAGDKGFAVGSSGTIFAVTNSATGVTFEEPKGIGGLPTTSSDVRSVSFPTPNVGYIVGTSGLALKTIDGGRSFTAIDPDPSSTTTSLYAMQFLDANQGWVAGASGFIARTDDGGQTWTKLTTPGTVTINAMEIKSPTLGYAVGNSGAVWKLDATGNFVLAGPVTGATSTTWRSVAIVSENEVYVGGSLESIARWDGAAWTLEATPPDWDYWYSLHALGPDTVIAGGDEGDIYKRTSAGWALVYTSGTSSDFYKMHFVDNLRGWAVGTSGYVVSTIDGGETWKRDTTYPGTSTNYAVWGFSATDLLVGSTSGALYRNASFVH